VISEFSIRPARPGDERSIFALIRALAEYERLTHAVSGDAQQLATDLFGARPAAEALVVEDVSATPPALVGFALFFQSYSTFLTRPGLYLEDIFILPTHRRCGLGKALLARVAQLARERGSGRLEWSVLNWNTSAIGFYESLGAKLLPDWRVCRVSGAELAALANESQPAESANNGQVSSSTQG
jgi:GNAT superfamily N-acetyltransferase